MRDTAFCTSACSMTRTMGVLGGKWKPIIITQLADRRVRFGQLAQRMPLISRKVLTEQLKELEEDGIVRREAFAELPPRVEYSLTMYGLELLPILAQLCAWHSAAPAK
ncbi:helix-turn-helix transcriptional regulator [Hymenobacter sp. BRD128]|uniref:winged helix-turn-helix transcriptional regulator n=1 Tax=Hymenobacter sp. BRD128 TaxID=2675878 RepID=UPI001563DC35|nr:helix-turn-helix domain-containing protein [Hymenobacter sp. BRD128]QKG57831.1 helix-turn-helix transcriptional regulator [Hymenobacter sp. BRD128]